MITTTSPGSTVVTVLSYNVPRNIRLTWDEALALTQAVLEHIASHPELLKLSKAGEKGAGES